MSKRQQRQREALLEIENLSGSRRKDIITCALALLTIILAVAAKTYLTAIGAIEAENMVVNAVIMFSAIGLAILGGTSSINFTKAGQRITYLKHYAGLSDDDVKDFLKSPRTFKL